jgi:hypothetical protein
LAAIATVFVVRFERHSAHVKPALTIKGIKTTILSIGLTWKPFHKLSRNTNPIHIVAAIATRAGALL